MPLPIPYVPDLSHFAIDDFVSFIVSLLIAVMVNAEGQAFMATALGDAHSDRKTRLHFNAFLHLDIWGTLCFFIAGFGWPKRVAVDTARFSSPRLYTILARLGGPVANFLMASIAGSILWILTRYGAEDRVFTMVVIVNLTVAVYSLIPIPPLAGSGILSGLFGSENKILKYFEKAGPYLLIALFLAERLTHQQIISGWLDPLVVTLFGFITKG